MARGHDDGRARVRAGDGSTGRFDDAVALAALAAHARRVYDGSVEDVLPTLLALAAAVGLPERRAVAILDEVIDAAAGVARQTREAGATNRVSKAAVREVQANAARLARRSG